MKSEGIYRGNPAAPVDFDDTIAAKLSSRPGAAATPRAVRDPRRLGVATQDRLRQAVHERVFGQPRDPVRIGRYPVLQRIGAGGMGIVYAAYDTKLDRKVALKLLHSAPDDGPGRIDQARLVSEAQALARLSHPAIIAVHEVGEHEGHVFIVMEFVDGPTLRAWVVDEAPGWADIVERYLEAGRGLAAAHSAGLVHRDFKPDNAIVAHDGRVRVLDFGLARQADDPAAGNSKEGVKIAIATPLTQTSALVGTPAYMAPEQFRGRAADARADQFAFCVSLWEALYGQRPFADRDADELVAAVLGGTKRAVPTNTKVPSAIHAVLERGLSSSADGRYDTMTELLDALEEAVGHRRGRVVFAAAALATFLAVAAGYALFERGRTHESRAGELEVAVASERARANEAEVALRKREDAVVMAESRILLQRDPTAAVAKLATLSAESGSWSGPGRALLGDAMDRGVATHVWPIPSGYSGGSVRHGSRPLRPQPGAAGSDWIAVSRAGDGAEVLLEIDGDETRWVGAGKWALLADGRILLSQFGRVIAISADGERTTVDTLPGAHGIELSRSGRFAAYVGGPDDAPVIRVVDTLSGQKRDVPAESAAVTPLGVSDDGRRLIVDEGGRLVAIEDNKRKVLVPRCSQPIAVSPDLRHLAYVGGRDHGDDIVYLKTAEASPRRVAAGDGMFVGDIVFDPTSARLAVREGTDVRVIELADGATTRLPTRSIPRHLAFSEDGEILAVDDDEQRVHVLRMNDGAIRTIHAGVPVIDLFVDPERDRLVVAGSDEVRVFADVLPNETQPLPQLEAAAVAIDAHARTIVSVDDVEGRLRVVHDGEVRTFRPWDKAITALAVAPDGLSFAAATGSEVGVWRVDGTIAAAAINHDASHSMVFDDEGRRVAWIGESGTLSVWRPGDPKPQTLEPPRLGIHAFAFIPGSERIGLVGWDDTGSWYYAFDPQRGVFGRLSIGRAPVGHPASVAFSSRGDMAVASNEEGLWITQLPSGPSRALRRGQVPYVDLRFTHDGSRLVANPMTDSVEVFDVDTGSSYTVHPAGFALREDGESLAYRGARNHRASLRVRELSSIAVDGDVIAAALPRYVTAIDLSLPIAPDEVRAAAMRATDRRDQSAWEPEVREPWWRLWID